MPLPALKSAVVRPLAAFLDRMNARPTCSISDGTGCEVFSCTVRRSSARMLTMLATEPANDAGLFGTLRARNVPNSPASFAGSVASIVNMRALDRLTVQLKTSQPVPSLIEQVGRAFILSRKAASGLTTADFNAGKGMVGTGPYKFVEWRPAQHLKLVRNAAYWGAKPDFENVTLK